MRKSLTMADGLYAKLKQLRGRCLGAQTALLLSVSTATAAEIHVAAGGSIQTALELAQPGDVIIVASGTYRERLETTQPNLTIQAEVRRTAIIVPPPGPLPNNVVVRVRHAHVTIEGMVVDGEYSRNRLLDASSVFENGAHAWADYLTLRDCEFKRASRDLIQVNEADNVLIDRCLIHHALRWGPNENRLCANGTSPRCDAHGVTGGNGRLENLTIRDTEIHTVSGDAIQIDPDRHRLGWDNVRVERSKLWNPVLHEDDPDGLNGFPPGVQPGENAIDTKTAGNMASPGLRCRLFVTDTVAHGWQQGPVKIYTVDGTKLDVPIISAWNIKENVDAVFDRVTTYDSQVAFRLRGFNTNRGPITATLSNVVLYRVEKAFRIEDQLGDPTLFTRENGKAHAAEPPTKIWHATIGADVKQVFQFAAGQELRSVVDLTNVLVLGSVPAELTTTPLQPGEWQGQASSLNFSGSHRLGVPSSAFADVATDDYHLASSSPAVDAGVAIPSVTVDRDGVARPHGLLPDVGAYESVGS